MCQPHSVGGLPHSGVVLLVQGLRPAVSVGGQARASDELQEKVSDSHGVGTTQNTHMPSPSARCCPLVQKSTDADIESAMASLNPPATALLPSPTTSMTVPSVTSVPPDLSAAPEPTTVTVGEPSIDVSVRAC